MALAQSDQAIGAVSRWLENRLTTWLTGVNVTIRRPEEAATSGNNPKLNLFLYETGFDGHMRNVTLDEGQAPPLWLALKYLLTAFDTSGNSDTPEAHELLGRGMSALQQLTFLPIDNAPANIQRALDKNPEPLKIHFDDVTAELLSKVMQGSDEKYRLSVGFHVSPVMIAPPEPPKYSLLVGIDYTTVPPAVIGEPGRRLDVLPSLGIRIDEVLPAQFEANSVFSLRGNDLNLSGVQVFLGPNAVTIQPPVASGELKCQVNGAIAGGALMSAGEYPLYARQALPLGRFRSSNLLVGALLPTVSTATTSGLTNIAGGRTHGNLRLSGKLLGTPYDDIIVAFYRQGSVERMVDFVVTNAGQNQLDLTVTAAQAIPSGNYNIIVRVNGQQARNSPVVAWS